MNQNSDFKLIKGVFAPEDAKEILFKLINSKIKFHQLEAFSNAERNVGDVSYSENRLIALEQMKEQIEERINEAYKNNKVLDIDGTISLKFVDKHTI